MWVNWLFNVLILCGMWANGRKWRVCFVLSGIGELGWTLTSLWTGQYDLAFICGVFVLMCILNYRRWGKSE